MSFKKKQKGKQLVPMKFDDPVIKERFCEVFGVDPNTRLIHMRYIEFAIADLQKSFKKTFGIDFANRIIFLLFEVDPKTYKKRMELENEAYKKGLTIVEAKSPRFTYFSLLSKVNFKITSNKTYEDHMRFCYNIFDMNGDGTVCASDLYNCLEIVVGINNKLTEDIIAMVRGLGIKRAEYFEEQKESILTKAQEHIKK